jgi:UDP:flavonoid glycosyltransferase YjiC (YdhE family)
MRWGACSPAPAAGETESGNCMRVLFTAWAWPSHFFPLVQLAWAIQTAGHETCVASQPSLAATIANSGLTAAAVGTDIDVGPMLAPLYRHLAAAGRPIEMPELIERFGVATVGLYVDLATNMLDDTLALAEHWRPDLIVFDPTTFAGPLVAAAIGVPAVRHVWGMDFTYLTHEFEPEALRPLSDRLGLPDVDTLGVATVDPCPPSLQAPHPVRRLNMRYAPYNGSAEYPEWLWNRPRPRVCVTGGTVVGHFATPGPSFESRVIEALSGMDVDMIVVSSERAVADSPNVRVVDRVAMHLLLPTCALAVHSGGGGMAMTAIASGTPQLVIPRNPDHLFNARRLQDAGAARMVPSVHATAGLIRDNAEELLGSSSYGTATVKLRQEMSDQPSAAQVAEALSELATGGDDER